MTDRATKPLLYAYIFAACRMSCTFAPFMAENRRSRRPADGSEDERREGRNAKQQYEQNIGTLTPNAGSEFAHSGPRDRNAMHVRTRVHSNPGRRNGRPTAETATDTEREGNVLLYPHVFVAQRMVCTFAPFMVRFRPARARQNKNAKDSATKPKTGVGKTAEP